MLEKIKLWLTEIRAPFLTASIVPVLLGAVIAWVVTGSFHWGFFLLTLVAGICLHIGTNVANDYFDHVSGNDEINVDFVRPFTGGSRMIQKGLMRPKEVLIESILFFTIGCIIGLYLAWTRGPIILLLGLIGVFSGFFYTAPPFRLANLGIGEAVVGVNFGVLMVVGSYYVQTGKLSWAAAAAGLPVSFLIAAVLYINEFPDYAADKAVGKNHLVVRWGKERAVVGYMVILALAYASVILGVAVKAITPYALIALLTVPLAIKAYRNAKMYHNNSRKLVPSNAATIMIHLSVGLLMCVGYVLERVMS
ncbi:MAG: 1,4-dihydroxy-2-naphthoate octaprenyltransferase [bacterium]